MKISSCGIIARYRVTLILACSIIALLLVAGCADIAAKQKVGDFGTAFGTSSEEQGAITWFITTYGDPRTNNDKPPRFIEPMITSAIDKNNLPGNKVTTFPVDGGSVYFFVIYDNFQKGDPITVTWTYLENGKQVSTVQQLAGGDFGRFIVEFQKPDSGWGKGNQEITVSGNGTSAKVDFAIGDTFQTTPLPYTAGQGSTGTTTTVTTTPAASGSGPVVTGISPSSGPVDGGTVITITGSGFTRANYVLFGNDLHAIDVVNSDTSITVTSPPMNRAQTVDVRVVINERDALPAVNPNDKFTFVAPVATVTTTTTTTSTSSTTIVTCPNNFILCDGKCVLANTNSNCGGCGVTCSGTYNCKLGYCVCDGGGFCWGSNGQEGPSTTTAVTTATTVVTTTSASAGLSCSSGQDLCGGKCVSLNTDSKNCGQCGNTCPSGQHCLQGSCQASSTGKGQSNT